MIKGQGNHAKNVADAYVLNNMHQNHHNGNIMNVSYLSKKTGMLQSQMKYNGNINMQQHS